MLTCLPELYCSWPPRSCHNPLIEMMRERENPSSFQPTADHSRDSEPSKPRASRLTLTPKPKPSHPPTTSRAPSRAPPRAPPSPQPPPAPPVHPRPRPHIRVLSTSATRTAAAASPATCFSHCRVAFIASSARGCISGAFGARARRGATRARRHVRVSNIVSYKYVDDDEEAPASTPAAAEDADGVGGWRTRFEAGAECGGPWGSGLGCPSSINAKTDVRCRRCVCFGARLGGDMRRVPCSHSRRAYIPRCETNVSLLGLLSFDTASNGRCCGMMVTGLHVPVLCKLCSLATVGGPGAGGSGEG